MYIISHALNLVRRSPNVKTRGTKLMAGVLLLAASGAAHAQIGGPYDAARAAAKKAPAEVPTTVSERFEKEGIAVNFSLTSTPDEKGQNPGLVVGSDATVTFRLS